MQSAAVTMQDVLHALPPTFWAGKSVSAPKRKVLRAIQRCGTGVFGWVLVRCEDCGHEEWVPRGCHNRNCPMCLPAAASEWVEAREKELLPTHYFHVVMTLPFVLRDLALTNPAVVYDVLMKAARDSLLEVFGNRKPLGCVPAILQVLHTWSQKLNFHPHVHMVVSGGGYNAETGRWVPCPNANYLFPGRALAAVYRSKLLAGLVKRRARNELDFGHASVAHLASREAFDAFVASLQEAEFVVHLNPPFGGPRQVVRYLARYTHRTAISNRRLISVKNGRVTFSYTNRKKGCTELRTMPVESFVTLFAVHIPPKGFHRVRMAGLIAPNGSRKLEAARTAAQSQQHGERFDEESPTLRKEPARVRRCATCGSSHLACLCLSVPAGFRGNSTLYIFSNVARAPPPSREPARSEENSA
jgi:hypothetical protein